MEYNAGSMTAARDRALLCLVLLAPAIAAAPQPSGPPPPAGGTGERGPEIHEHSPTSGASAQAGVMAGGSWNPYDVGRGIQAAGYIDLPLARAPGGKLSYEIVIGLSHADSDPYPSPTR